MAAGALARPFSPPLSPRFEGLRASRDAAAFLQHYRNLNEKRRQAAALQSFARINQMHASRRVRGGEAAAWSTGEQWIYRAGKKMKTADKVQVSTRIASAQPP